MADSVMVALIGGAATVIVTGMNIILTNFLSKRNKRSDKEESICVGIQCLLRAEIMKTYEQCIEKGFCPLHIKQVATSAFKAYHALGGNGFISDLYEKIMSMGESLGKEN